MGKIKMDEMDITECRKDVKDTDKCFLIPPIYAHATTIENAKKIVAEGLKVMPTDKRVHKYFQSEAMNMCKKAGVFDEACKARENSVFAYADINGAIDQTLYIGRKIKGVKLPAVVIIDATGKDVVPDIENSWQLKGKTVKQIIDEYPEDSVPVSIDGGISPENIKCVCGLDADFVSKIVPKLPPDIIDDPEKHGFRFKPEKYGVEEGTDAWQDAYDKEYQKFIIKKENALKFNFSEYLASIGEDSEDYYQFENGILDMSNWSCDCKNLKEK